MPMYSPPPRAERGAQQQMQAVGREAPQRGNYGGGTSRQRVPGQQAPGLSAALSGGQQRVPVGPYINRPGFSPRPAPQPAPQPAPRQVQNRAFANWNEPGSAYGQAPVQPAGATWNAPPVRMYPVDQTGGMDAMLDRRGVGAPSYTGAPVEATVLQPRPNIRPIPSMAAQKTRSDGPRMMGPATGLMMGPATGQMSLSGAINSAPTNRGFWNDLGQGAQNAFQQWAQSTQDDSSQPQATSSGSAAVDAKEEGYKLTPEERAAAMNDGLDPDDPEVIKTFSGASARQSGSKYKEPEKNWIDKIFDPAGRADLARGAAEEVQNFGYESGRAAGAFPAGMAEALNEYTREDMMKYYDDMRDIEKLKTQGESLMDPEQQAAADAAERAQMQAGINSQRDEQLRMLMGQRGRGGMVGSGAATGLLNSALRAQALGEQNLAQDQYQRMLGRNQLGGQLISDYGRQKYGLMNDAYASPGEIASLLLQGAQTGVNVANNLPGSQNPFLSILGIG